MRLVIIEFFEKWGDGVDEGVDFSGFVFEREFVELFFTLRR